MIGAGDSLVFVANDGASGTELWISDGTEAGTRLLADINPGPAGSSPADLVYDRGVLSFTAYRRDVGRELWTLDLDGCPADINGDGVADADDLADFISCFFAGSGEPANCPAADFDHDGNVNADDLASFIGTYFAVC